MPIDPCLPVAPTPTLAEVLEATAREPASAAVDGQSATAHSPSEIIKALRYLDSAKAAKTGRVGWTGVARARAVPPEAG